MRKLGTVALLVLGALLLTGTDTPGAEKSTRPPTKLKKVGEHWTPWDPPAPGAGNYIIQKDDTLWDLAGKWLGNPFLWPQIWDENRYILDSHWIYPGDPLVVPGKPTVVPEGEQPPSAELTTPGAGATEQAQVKRPSPPAPPPLLPAADRSDVYCSGYIDPQGTKAELWISARDKERIAMGEGDVVFVNQGRNAGVRAGDEFLILRRTQHVLHPATGEDLGVFVRRLGRGRVLMSHDTTATMVIDMSCEEIYLGDELRRWEEIPVPLLASTPRFDWMEIESSGGPSGHVVWQRDQLTAFGTGNVIYTDLGQLSGVNPGDFIRLYRERDGGLPRQMLGQAVILTVESGTSTAKITQSVRESMIGDRVELRR